MTQKINELEIVKNNRGYDGIDLFKMGNGDSIVVTKKFAEAYKNEGEKDYGDGPKKWVLYTAKVVYNDVDLSFVIKKSHSPENKIITAEDYVKMYNECGGEGDKVKITCTKEMGASEYDFKPLFKKGDDIIKVAFTFEKVE